MSKKLLFIVVAAVITIILWSGVFSHPATSQQVDFRVNNLESDVRRLEFRLNQIELLINKNTPISSSRTTEDSGKPQIDKRNLSRSERDKMFARLSTLFVELKQQVNHLEKRVVKLESGK